MLLCLMAFHFHHQETSAQLRRHHEAEIAEESQGTIENKQGETEVSVSMYIVWYYEALLSQEHVNESYVTWTGTSDINFKAVLIRVI